MSETCAENPLYCGSANDRRGRRRSKRVFVLSFMTLFLSSSHVDTVRQCSAFTPPAVRYCTRYDRHRHTANLSSTSVTSLSSMTVKELRELVKKVSQNERGLLSRLKRKQDLIDFIKEQSLIDIEGSSIDSSSQTSKKNGIQQGPTQSELASASSGSEMTTRSPGRPRNMPKLSEEDLLNGNTKGNADSKQKPSPKDIIMEEVYQRYPPLRTMQRLQQLQTEHENDEDDEDVDIRQLHHPMLRNQDGELISSSDMDLVFVGTASCTPGTTRGVSCTALRLNWNRRAAFLNEESGKMEQVSTFQGGTWLFDVGECTQLQIQRTSSIKPSKITRIFLTHAHGDHSFGLPGLLCLMGQDRDRANSPPVEIYGPEGLRMWLRVAIRYSVSRIVPPYRVHEIMDVPMAPEWDFNQRIRRYYFNAGRHRQRSGHHDGRWGAKGLSGEDSTNWISQANRMQLAPSSLYGEIEGGRDIYPIYDHPMSTDGAPVWEVEDEEDVKVYAAPMSHGIPCLGYVVDEQPRPGRLRNEYVEPIVRRNVVALKKAGFAIPMKAMAVIKNLKPGSEFTFPDGTVVTQEDAVEPPRRGRKVVLCGDTADSRSMLNLAKGADVVIHECTNAYLPGVDKDTTLRDVTRDAVVHGHSTPQIAGEFCRSAGAKRLVLNHFSARYKGDISADSMSIMMRIEKQAMKAAQLNETQVAAAWDLMVLPVPQN